MAVHVQDFLGASSAAGAQLSVFGDDEDLVPHGSVDLVIANPPYVRTQTMGRAVAELLVRRYGIKGRVDLYMAFVFAISDVLRAGGVMALLCSNRFLTTRGGASLRHLLQTEFSVSEIYDFGDTRQFDAAVLPAVVIARKAARAHQARFVSVYRAEVPESSTPISYDSVPALVESTHVGLANVAGSTLRVRRGQLNALADPARPWTLDDPESAELQRRLAASTHRTIGSLTKIRVGIKTTADSVFIRADWDSLPPQLQPEEALLHPLLTHHIARRWVADVPTRFILYPHSDSNGRTEPVDLAEYPRAAAYLQSNHARLASREYVMAGGRRWYEIWVPQRASLWARPKSCFQILRTLRGSLSTRQVNW